VRGTLISFDIDGTLEVGIPPGIITVATVLSAKNLGYVIGSCSDRPLSHQREIWEELQIVPDFTVLKHRLGDVRAAFLAATYYHVGDTDVDHVAATDAGFTFVRADLEAFRAWSAALRLGIV
jgi:hypothetical protein